MRLIISLISGVGASRRVRRASTKGSHQLNSNRRLLDPENACECGWRTGRLSVLHAIAEEGIPTRAIAEAIGSGLDLSVVSVPAEQANEHFGWLGRFFAADSRASNELTRKLLGWEPTHQGLIADLKEGHYFQTQPAEVGDGTSLR